MNFVFIHVWATESFKADVKPISDNIEKNEVNFEMGYYISFGICYYIYIYIYMYVY